MARTEADPLSDMTLGEMRGGDAAAGLALSAEAGWNQTADDWSMMIRLGQAFAIAAPDSRLVATALALPYPPDFGWISMVLVHGPCRRRGLGRLLLARAVSELESRGLVPFLDATPAGRPVYERMGFRPVEALTRWQGSGGGQPAPVGRQRANGDTVTELDRTAFGADRSPILADLIARPGAQALDDPDGKGFCLSRPGRTATYIGPLVARETAPALELLDAALSTVSGPALIDVPDRDSAVARLLSERGFRAERPLTRMALRRDTGFGEAALRRAIAGPELG